MQKGDGLGQFQIVLGATLGRHVPFSFELAASASGGTTAFEQTLHGLKASTISARAQEP
jgi:hypothetical protein